MNSAAQATFEVHTGTPGMDLTTTVAYKNVLGSNGTLASAYYSGSAFMSESDASGG